MVVVVVVVKVIKVMNGNGGIAESHTHTLLLDWEEDGGWMDGWMVEEKGCRGGCRGKSPVANSLPLRGAPKNTNPKRKLQGGPGEGRGAVNLGLLE